MANDRDDHLDDDDVTSVAGERGEGEGPGASVWAAAGGDDLDDLDDDPWAPRPGADLGGEAGLAASGKLDVGPATGPVRLPDWTEPPTGQVPRVVLGDDAEGAAQRTGSQPRWRSDSGDWDEADFEEGMFDDDDVRVGALDPARSEGNPYSFEEDIPSGPTPAVAVEEPPTVQIGDEDPAQQVAPIRTRSTNGDDVATVVGVSSRDMPMALLVGGGFFLAAVFLFLVGGRVGPFLLSLFVVMACAYELFGTFQRAGLRPAPLLGLTACFCLMVGTYAKGLQAMPLVLVLSFVASMLWYLTKVIHARPLLGVGATMTGIVWVGLMGSFAALLLHGTEAHRPILFGAIVCTIASDVGGLLGGSMFGRTPIAPGVSPNKTVEGTVAGFLAALVAGIVVGLFSSSPSAWDGSFVNGAMLGIVAGVLAPLGDLSQSMVKRDLGVKDMGNALPGHGGFLDRFDSLLFVLPGVYFLAQVLVFPNP